MGVPGPPAGPPPYGAAQRPPYGVAHPPPYPAPNVPPHVAPYPPPYATPYPPPRYGLVPCPPGWTNLPQRNTYLSDACLILPHGGVASQPRRPGQVVRMFAHPWQRLVGRLVDTALIAVAAFVGYAVSLPFGAQSPVSSIVVVSLGMLAALTEPVLTAMYGASVGKLVVGMRVVQLSAVPRPPGFGISFARWLMYSLMHVINVLALLDSLWLLWDRPKVQCLHDKVVGTVVLTKHEL